MIKFNQDIFELFNYTFHSPKFACDYVRENGAYRFSTIYNNKKVEVKLSTGNTFCMGDYEFPDPDYTVDEVVYSGTPINLDQVMEYDYELYEAICDLPSLVNSYSRNVEDYTFFCVGRQEDNFGDEITVEYADLDLGKFTVIHCNRK